MTPKVQLNLEEARCAKKRCKHSMKGKPLHRHHVRHKKFWINRFKDSRNGLAKGRDWEVFAKGLEVRYYKFLPRDLVRLCDYHHVEIHAIYSRIIRRELWKIGHRPSVRDAVRVMRLCKQACLAWLGKETSGLNPKRAGWINN